MIIRVATTADYPAMDNLFRASAKTLCVDAYDTDTLDAWAGESWPARFADSTAKGHQHYVMLVDNQVCCFGTLHIEQQLLTSLFVAPAHAGNGIGQAMLAFLMATAKDAGVHTVQLESSLNAVKFYARHGFVEKSRGAFSTQSGVVLQSVHMERVLSRAD